MVWCCWRNQVSSSNAGLSAFASADTQKKVIEMLSLNKSVQLVVHRENRKLYLQNVTNEISDNFMWPVHELQYPNRMSKSTDVCQRSPAV